MTKLLCDVAKRYVANNVPFAAVLVIKYPRRVGTLIRDSVLRDADILGRAM